VNESPMLVTARELAERIRLSPATVLDKWERGEFPGYQFGRAVRFDLDEILALCRRPGGRVSQPARLELVADEE
jgi:excisionase family DNA binding protein